MRDVEKKLREAVKDLLSSERVEVVIGYENGTLPLTSRPCFVRSPDDAERLVWNSFCANNLAVYLPRMFQRPAHVRGEWTPPKVGIVAKGCDSRSVVGLLKEHQVPRENVVIVGVPCPGMVDSAKVEAAAGKVSGAEDLGDGTIEVTTAGGGNRKVDCGEAMAEACMECAHPLPKDVDVLIEGEARAASEARFVRIGEFAGKPPAERWTRFTEEASKCIRCYACRQACPNCYCKVCFVDQSKPRWVGAGSDRSDVLLFHIIRAFHQAGRCVECDACVRACPMGLDLRLFTQKLVQDVEELFEYVPGLSVEDLPPLCTFTESDSEAFITEP